MTYRISWHGSCQLPPAIQSKVCHPRILPYATACNRSASTSYLTQMSLSLLKRTTCITQWKTWWLLAFMEGWRLHPTHQLPNQISSRLKKWLRKQLLMLLQPMNKSIQTKLRSEWLKHYCLDVSLQTYLTTRVRCSPWPHNKLWIWRLNSTYNNFLSQPSLKTN